MKTKGVLFIMLATLAFAVMNITAKALVTFHPMQIVFFRAFGTFVFIFPYMVINKVSIVGNNVKFLLLRALAGALSLSFFFMAIEHTPLGSAISIRYLGPIFGAIISFYWLKEKVYPLQWLCFAISFLGVILLKGFDIRIDNYSLILLIVSAISVGFVFALIRYLGDKEHYMTIINYFMVTAIVISLFFVDTWRWPVASEWYPVAGIGIFGLIGQIFMTRAFQEAEASVLAPFKYMELIYAILMGYFFFGESYTMASLLAIILIMSGMIFNVYIKNYRKA